MLFCSAFLGPTHKKELSMYFQVEKGNLVSQSQRLTFFISAAVGLGQQRSHLLKSNSLIRVERGKGIRLIRGGLSVASNHFSLPQQGAMRVYQACSPHIKCCGHLLGGICGFMTGQAFFCLSTLVMLFLHGQHD